MLNRAACAPERRASRGALHPAAFQVPVSSALFTPRKGVTPFRSFTSTGDDHFKCGPHGAAGQFAPRVCLRQIIGAICQRPAARSLPGALGAKCARHRCGGGLRPCPHWRSGFALRGLSSQSPNNIYQADPFCPSLRSHAPSLPKHPLTLLGQPKTAAPSTPNPLPGSALWRFPISSESVFSLACARRLLRQFRGVPAPLFQDHPPDPCARDAHPEEIPRAQDGFYRFAAKGTSSANQKPNCTVASLPSRILRSRFAGCDPP